MKKYMIFIFLLVSSQAWGGTFNNLDGVADTAGVVRGSKVSLFSAGRHFLQFPDTTISVNASGKRVLWYNLHDPRFVEQSDRFNYDMFRVAELNTSYRAVEGPMPSYGYITITAGGDSVVFRNALTGSVWMVFVRSSTNMVYATSSALTDVSFLDGVLRVGGPSHMPEVDFLRDHGAIYTTGGIYEYNGTIAQRNAGLGITVLNAGISIVNQSVNSVSAIRDPGGKRDPATGRLAQWWIVETAGGASVYNPYTNGIYDSGSTLAGGWIDLLPNGSMIRTTSTAVDSLYWKYSVASITADGWLFNGRWDRDATNRSGSEKLAWGTAATMSRAIGLSGGSWAGTNAPVFAVAGSSGIYLLHAKANDNTSGGQQLIESGFNSGYMAGNVYFSLPLESSAADVSPNAQVLTVSGSGSSYATAVIGKGFVTAGTGYIAKTSAATLMSGTSSTHRWSVCAWDSTASASNPSAIEQIISLADATEGSANGIIQLHFSASGGTVAIRITDDGFATHNDIATSSADVYDNKPHFYVGTFDGSTLSLYVDGELSATDASIVATGTISPVRIGIGASSAGNQITSGTIDNAQALGRVLTASEIRDMYRQGIAGLNSTVSPCDCLPGHIGGTTDSTGYVKAHPSGRWLLGNQDSLMVLDKYGIPSWKMGAPGGLIQDADFADVGGGDSLGVVVVGKAKTGSAAVVYQRIPDVRVADLAGYQWPFKQPLIGKEVVVDSSGVNGLFWSVDDAIDAGANMGNRNIFIEGGHYPPFDLDQPNMVIRGSGNKTVIDGGTTDDAIDVTAAGDSSLISYLSVITGSGGTCNSGNCNGVAAVNGAVYNTYDHLTVWDADKNAFDMQGGNFLLTGSTVNDADGMGVYVSVGGSSSRVNATSVFSTGSTAIRAGNGIAALSVVNSEADHATLGIIEAGTGSTQIVITGNVTNAGVVNNSGSTSYTTGNVQY